MLSIELVTIYFKCKILSLVTLGICSHLLKIVCPRLAYIHIYFATLGICRHLLHI